MKLKRNEIMTIKKKQSINKQTNKQLKTKVNKYLFYSPVPAILQRGGQRQHAERKREEENNLEIRQQKM